MKSVKRLHTIWLFLFVLYLPLSSQAQDQDLEMSLARALYVDDSAAVEELVSAHRLDIKPVVEAWIVDALAGDDMLAMDLATQLAQAFEDVHGEKSLVVRTEYAASLSRADQGTKVQADSLYEDAVARRGNSDEREAVRDQLLEVEALYRSIEDRAGLAATLGQLGYISWFLDRPSYLTYNVEALALRREIDDRQLMGNTLNDLGLYHRAIDRDFRKALDVYQESETIRWAIGDSVALSRTLPNIALSYEGIGDFESALTYYHKGAELYLAVGDTARYIGQRNNSAGVLTDVLERHSEALLEMLQLKEELKAIDDPRTEALVTNSIGVVSRRLGDFENAILNYQDVIALSEEHGFDDLLAGALNNIGVVMIWMERFDRAAPFFERARDVLQNMDEPDQELMTLINLGSANFETKNFEASIDWLNQARDMAVEYSDSVSLGSIEIGLGNSKLRTEGPEAAQTHYENALVIAGSFEVPDLHAGALFGMGEAAEHLGRADEALDWYVRGAESMESTRGLLRAEEDKAGYLAQQRYLFEDVIDFMSRQAVETADPAWTAASFSFAEQAKARAFVDQLAEALADVENGVDPQLLEDQQVLTDNLVWLRDELTVETDRERRAELKALIREQETEFDRVERDLRERNTAYAQLRYPEPVDLLAVQSRLSPEDLALSYSVGDTSSTVWAITTSDVSVHLLPVRDELSSAIDVLRFALEDPDAVDAATFGASSSALHDMLVGPVAGKIASADRVIIMADDVLNYVPFEALTTEAGASWADHTYLLEAAEFVYVPSATVWAQLTDRERPEATHDFLAVGNPDFGTTNSLSNLRGATLEQLPFTEEEVDRIAQLFPTDRTRVLTGQGATESAVRDAVSNASYRFVHFATHGLIDDDRPDYSALALAVGSTTGEGLLQASEIFNLSFNADLVVLSACETGLGQLIQGEGMVGLTRAFMYAGASSLVVSLWSVSDSSTAALMQHFYNDMIGKGQSKAQALRSAKRALLQHEETSHPFHWAPFILTGAAQ